MSEEGKLVDPIVSQITELVYKKAEEIAGYKVYPTPFEQALIESLALLVKQLTEQPK